MTVSQLSTLLLWFLRGGTTKCRKHIQNAPSFMKNVDLDPNKGTPNNDNQIQLLQKKQPLPSIGFQLNTDRNKGGDQDTKSLDTNDMAETMMKTNSRLKKELKNLQQENGKVNVLIRQKRNYYPVSQDDTKWLYLKKGESYSCDKEIDENTAQMLNKLSLKMNTIQVESLAKLFTTFISNTDTSNIYSQNNEIFSSMETTPKISTAIHPNFAKSVNNNQNKNAKRIEHERQIQALSNIMSRRRKRSIVDFEKGLHRGFYAHKVDEFPHSMRIKQKERIIEGSTDLPNDGNKAMIEIEQDSNHIRTKDVRDENKVEVGENCESKPQQIEEESNPVHKELESFPTLERTVKERGHRLRQLHGGPNNDQISQKRKNTKRKKVESLRKEKKQKFPSSSRVKHQNNAPNGYENGKLSALGIKRMPDEAVLVNLLKDIQEDEKEILPNSMDQDKNKSGIDHRILDSEMKDRIEKKVLFKEDKKRRNKRNIVDFENGRKEVTEYKLRDDAANDMTKINHFPDSERTKGKNLHPKNFIFGLKVKKRKPITNFEDFELQSKSRRRGDKIININQFPRTERLIAPKALKHERRRKSKIRSKDKEEIDILKVRKKSGSEKNSKRRKNRHKNQYQI